VDSPLRTLRDAGRRLRARARVTERLRELSPMSAWRERRWVDLLGLNRNIALQAVKIGVASAVSWLAPSASSTGGGDGDRGQPPLPMAADMLTSTAGAIEAFAAGLLPTGGAAAGASLGTARAAVDAARARIEEINADLADLMAANLPRGVYLGTLVVETGRILDELDAGLARTVE
jgi:hypothetical protein